MKLFAVLCLALSWWQCAGLRGTARLAVRADARSSAAPPPQPPLAKGQTAERPNQVGTEVTLLSNESNWQQRYSWPSDPVNGDRALPLKAVFLDFDGSTVIDNTFSPDNIAQCKAIQPGCPGAALAGVMANTSAATVTMHLGGSYRQAAIRQWLQELRSAGILVYMLSTSFAPISGESWCLYLQEFSKLAQFDFPAQQLICLDDPGEGIAANKGAAIETTMASLGLEAGNAILLDDGYSNAVSASAVGAGWIWLGQRIGYSFMDMEYISARVAIDKLKLDLIDTRSVRLPSHLRPDKPQG